MKRNTVFSKEDIEWLKSYGTEVEATFRARLDAVSGRFPRWKSLLDRFAGAVQLAMTSDRSAFRRADEIHNELCIANALLRCTSPEFTLLEYEPPIPRCAKSIDFRARTHEGNTLFVDVKTIKPERRDRWEQFKRAQREKWFPRNVEVILSRKWLGGELWHNMFASRSRMLEYTVEMEDKIARCNITAEKSMFVLVFCGEGFHWHESELEDFVAFYATGKHRPDDPFAKAEEKYIAEKGITLTRCISRFACMKRSIGAIDFRRLNWHVQPPNEAMFSYGSNTVIRR